MKFSCTVGFHKWDGCKCPKCSAVRAEGHDWSKDCEKCGKCGASRQNRHSWADCKCSACGKLRGVTENLTEADLFQLLGDRPIASNIARMFALLRMTQGGTRLVDLHYENGIVLWNVRIAEERFVTIPAAYKDLPIKTVGAANLERHNEWPAMRAEIERTN